MIAVGTSVGAFIVVRPLGRGGASTVYAVRHRALGTEHALKVVHERGSRARLRTEGLLQGRIDVPNILPVQAVLDVGGEPALLMPVVRGCSLKELLEIRSLSLDEALALFSGIVQGVAAAHTAGIVHRDLKPSNVLLDPESGRVVPRIADFGVARLESSVDTDTGAFVGTRGYAAPEQLRDASRVDHRADLWSLGVILYEMVTRRRPAGVPELSSEMPEALRALLTGLLVPDPAHRWASAVDLRQRLGEPATDVLVRHGPLGDAVQQRYALVHGATEPTTSPLEPTGPAVPNERDRFIGRRIDLQRLEAAIDQASIVTITGFGGVGKTRLLVHFLRRPEQAARGVAWCDLANCRDEASLVAAMAEGLGLPLEQPTDGTRLGFALREHHDQLIAIDNVEQVAGPLASLLTQWTTIAPDARFVTTSRIPLEVAGERRLQLSPLEPGDAETLFVERATAADAGFDPDHEEPDMLRRLVDALDGVPLAIELAARRVRLLGVSVIHERLADRFQLLTGAKDRPARQATLRATLDWSWALLRPDDQRALAQLSVFEGAFAVDMAESLIDIDDWPLDALDRLLEHSLLQVADKGRLRLLAAVRAYATEALAELGEQRATEMRHGRAFAQLAERVLPDAMAFRPQGPGVLGREVGNLLAACERAIERHDVTVAVATLRGAWAALDQRGGSERVAALAERVLALPGLGGRHEAWTRQVHAGCLERAGRWDDSNAAYRASIAQWRQLGDDASATVATLRHATVLGHQSRTDEARALLLDAVDVARGLGRSRLLVGAQTALGIIAHQHGRHDEARASYQAALAQCRADDALEEARLCNLLGVLCTVTGEFEDAHRHLDRAEDQFTALGTTSKLPDVLIHKGNLAIWEGQLDVAEQHLQRARTLTRTLGLPRPHAIILGNLGVLLEQQGALRRACEVLREAWTLNEQLGYERHTALAQLNLGRIRGVMGALDASLPLTRQALDKLAALGERSLEVEGRVGFTDLLLSVGRVDEARVELDRTFELLRHTDNRLFEHLARAYLGDLTALEGDGATANTHWDDAIEGLRAIGVRAELAKVLARRARRQATFDVEAAARALDEAETLAEALAAPAEGELHQTLAESREAVDTARSSAP